MTTPKESDAQKLFEKAQKEIDESLRARYWYDLGVYAKSLESRLQSLDREREGRKNEIARLNEQAAWAAIRIESLEQELSEAKNQIITANKRSEYHKEDFNFLLGKIKAYRNAFESQEIGSDFEKPYKEMIVASEMNFIEKHKIFYDALGFPDSKFPIGGNKG